MAALLAVSPTPAGDHLLALAGRYGLTLHLERLPELSQRYAVTLG